MDLKLNILGQRNKYVKYYLQSKNYKEFNKNS